MTTIVTTCRQCGREHEPSREAIVRGQWQRCPDSRTGAGPAAATTANHCPDCGRPLRTAGRALCSSYLSGDPGQGKDHDA